MAITYASIHVLSSEAVSAHPHHFTSWSLGWQSLIPTEENSELLTKPELSMKAAKKLSKTLAKTVLWFFIFDEDEISFALFSEGKTAATYNYQYASKNISKVPALIGLEESYRARLSKILDCTNTELQTQLLEEFFGVKLLLFPEMLEDFPAQLTQIRSNILFQKFAAESKVPTGKRSPIQTKLLFELEGVLSDADWNKKYHNDSGYLWVFQKHYWLYKLNQHTGETEYPVCFRNGKLDFISDEEMLRYGADQRYNETRNTDPLFTCIYLPSRITFSEDAPHPYAAKTLTPPRGYHALGFDAKGRFLLYDDASSFSVMDDTGKLLAKQSVKGLIRDHDGDYLLTWEEKWDVTVLNGKKFPKRWYGIIRGYQIFDV